MFFKKKIFYSKNVLDPQFEKLTKTFNIKKPHELAILLKNDTFNKYITSEIKYKRLCNDTNKVDNYLKVIHDYKKINFTQFINT